MSVLIKGMEPPTSCFDCPFMYGRKYCRANSKIEFNDPDYSELKGRYDGCPLVPVPEHGRAIDADDFIKRMTELMQKAEKDDFALGAAWYETFIRHIELAPTVISEDEVV